VGLEVVIRPFAEPDNGPTPFHPAGAVNVPPVRLTVGLVGGTKTWAFSMSFTQATKMAAVHTEKTQSVFDMTTGQLAG
jgi:hypothetical protein